MARVPDILVTGHRVETNTFIGFASFVYGERGIKDPVPWLSFSDFQTLHSSYNPVKLEIPPLLYK